MDGAVSARIVTASAVLIAGLAVPAVAQTQVMPSLADVARKAEAAKATQVKAKKSYTNADLHPSLDGPAARIDTAKGQAVAASGKATATEEAPKSGGDKAGEPAAAAQNMPEEHWRQRADFIRNQVEKAKAELALRNAPAPGRSAALEKLNANEILKYQQMIDGAMKQWAALEASAHESKVPAAWIGSAPTP
jgi:hypothetical protein